MPGLSNVDEYQKLTKDQLIELVQMYGRLALTLDGLWFLGVEGRQGIEKAIEVDEEVWRQFGKTEAKRLKTFLRIDLVSQPEEICRIYLLTATFGNLGARAEIRGSKCYLSAADCHAQKTRVRKGTGEFPCKSVGVAYFDGFVKELNPGTKYRCVFCPPDKHPDGPWCQWEVWIEPQTGESVDTNQERRS